MADAKISALPASAGLAAADLIAVVDDPAGTPATQKATFTQLLAFIAANQTTMLSLSGSAFAIVGGSASSATNGTNLVNAYAAAKVATPHGAALSAQNRFTIYMLPGLFTLTGGALVLDTQFIDLVGLGTDPSEVKLTSTGKTVSVTANDVTLRHFWIDTTAAGAPTDNTSDYAYFPNTALSLNTCIRLIFTQDGTTPVTNSNTRGMRRGIDYAGYYEDCLHAGTAGGFGVAIGANTATASGTFIRCKAGSTAFGAGSGATSGTASGLFIECETNGGNSFGGSDGATTGIASGTFIRCRCGFQVNTPYGNLATTPTSTCFGRVSASGTFIDCESAGGGWGTNGTAGGTFIRCRAIGSFAFGAAGTASGTFIDCTAATYAFAGSNGAGGTASGTFTNCVAGGSSFAGGDTTGGTAGAGVFTNCVAGAQSFGGGAVTGGTASGTFRNCTGGTHSFGSGPTNGTMSGTMENCAMSGHMRVTLTGKMTNCRVEAVAPNTTALQISSTSTGAVYSCSLVGTGTGVSIDVISGTPTIKIAHCRLNKGIGASVTNSIATPYNVDDTNVT